MCDIDQGTSPFVGPLASPEMVAVNPCLGRLSQLRFLSPRCFRAGGIHSKATVWQRHLKDSCCSQINLMEIVQEGIKVNEFFRHFKGSFKGASYDSDHPPNAQFVNSPVCRHFDSFITTTIIEWVSTGVLAVWGAVGTVPPPHLVLPLTVEPSKPRLCHDERFLNLWVRDLPFKLDHLSDLPRYVLPGHYQTTFDDKSGYQHVLLHPSSYAYFGLEWKGLYFVFRTLPFGWKASAFVYHNLGLAVSGTARSLGVPVSQYIDDRHVGQLFGSPTQGGWLPSPLLAEAAAYIMCYLLVEAGYFVGLEKSQCSPSTCVRFLGFLCDSSLQAFIVPEDKKKKFKVLREEILSTPSVTLKSLQRFAGKALSLSLAIPGCKLYVREIFKSISRLHQSSRAAVKLQGELRSEILYWRFLDEWEDCLPWRSERHLTVSLFSDASKHAWGGILVKDGCRYESKDYWPETTEDINILEARALLNSLMAFQDQIRNSRVDVHTDSRVLKCAWENGGCKSSATNRVLKSVLECSRLCNFSMDVRYIPSGDNPADGPSRQLSDLDCTLSGVTWSQVDRFFGPHTFDLMSLDSNSQRDRFGNPLPHFTPWPAPGSQGVNVFAQPLPQGHNIYVFPPFVLVGPLLRYIYDQRFSGSLTLVVPDLHPRHYWWALIHSIAVDRFLLGKKGCNSVLLFPSRRPQGWTARPLQWDLWAFRCVWQSV